MKFYVVLAAGLLILGYLIFAYNYFVTLVNSVKEAFSTMDVYLKKRWDLVPNLVEVVKGYAKHESSVLERVTELRNMSYDQMSLKDKIDTNEKLSMGLAKLIAVVENYPDLKADKNFLELSFQLSRIEDEIANSRKYYNAVVKKMNTQVEMFPSNLIAKLFSFRQSPFFEAQADERNSVKVELQ